MRAAERREWLNFAQSVAQFAVNEDKHIIDIREGIYQEYRNLTSRRRSSAIISGAAVMERVYSQYDEYVSNPSLVRGLKTNIPSLDQYLMGIRPGLYAVGGASSMGKSTFTGGLTYNLLTQTKVVYVPTEISADRAVTKIATDMAGIPFKKFISGYLSPEDHEKFHDAYFKLCAVQDNLSIVDSTTPSVADAESEIARSGAKVLIVDSGTAMAYQGTADSRKKQKEMRIAIGELCQQLQNIARSGVAVIATWQTGRNAKNRESKVPRLNDFKESGNIEETADVCLALYRHAYYVKRQEAEPKDKEFPPNTAAIFVLKDRDGGEGDGKITVGFRPGHGFTGDVDLNR
jgi:replicative DNA helicase